MESKMATSILYLNGVNVSFDGFKALEQPVARGRKRRDARDHRPQRRRQDHDDGRHHRQDPAGHAGDVLFDGSADLTKLDETQIAELGIGRKFQKPTVFEMHTVEDNILLALKADRRVRGHAVLDGNRRDRQPHQQHPGDRAPEGGARSRRRQPVARPEAMAGDRHAAGAGAKAAAGRRAGRRHDRRRDPADRATAARRSTATRPWSWSSTT